MKMRALPLGLGRPVLELCTISVWGASSRVEKEERGASTTQVLLWVLHRPCYLQRHIALLERIPWGNGALLDRLLADADDCRMPSCLLKKHMAACASFMRRHMIICLLFSHALLLCSACNVSDDALDCVGTFCSSPIRPFMPHLDQVPQSQIASWFRLSSWVGGFIKQPFCPLQSRV
jgi:hypothetical protein